MNCRNNESGQKSNIYSKIKMSPLAQNISVITLAVALFIAILVAILQSP